MSEKKYDIDLVTVETMREYCQTRIDFETDRCSGAKLTDASQKVLLEAEVKTYDIRDEFELVARNINTTIGDLTDLSSHIRKVLEGSK